MWWSLYKAWGGFIVKWFGGERWLAHLARMAGFGHVMKIFFGAGFPRMAFLGYIVCHLELLVFVIVLTTGIRAMVWLWLCSLMFLCVCDWVCIVVSSVEEEARHWRSSSVSIEKRLDLGVRLQVSISVDLSVAAWDLLVPSLNMLLQKPRLCEQAIYGSQGQLLLKMKAKCVRASEETLAYLRRPMCLSHVRSREMKPTPEGVRFLWRSLWKRGCPICYLHDRVVACERKKSTVYWRRYPLIAGTKVCIPLKGATKFVRGAKISLSEEPPTLKW